MKHTTDKLPCKACAAEVLAWRPVRKVDMSDVEGKGVSGDVGVAA